MSEICSRLIIGRLLYSCVGGSIATPVTIFRPKVCHGDDAMGDGGGVGGGTVRPRRPR